MSAVNKDIQKIEDLLGIERCDGCGEVKETCICAHLWLVKNNYDRPVYKASPSEKQKRETRARNQRFQSKLKSKFKGKR